LGYEAVVAFFTLPAVQGIFILALLLVVLIWHRSRKTPVDLMDLVLYDGKLSSRKLFESSAFALTSIWFMGKILTGTADATDALAYAGLWTAARATGQYLHSRAEKPPETPQKPAGGSDAWTVQ